MAVPKICGIEQEYAIALAGGISYDPIQLSYLVVNSFERAAAQTAWDYAEETPFLDARGFSYDDTAIQISRNDNLRINNLLVNGARFYVDHAHPEFSTAECLSVRDLIAFDRAGERVLDIAREEAAKQITAGREILIFKNNSDHKGNSYGCHENYLVSTELYQRLFMPMKTLNGSQPVMGVLIPFFVSRQILCGAGKVGSENGTPHVDYQISQRSDFFEIAMGANTTANRPIINTRDEPHADKTLFRRLHVIVGDSNMCEVAGLLKVGTARLVLSMLEDNAINLDFALEQPVKAMIDVSHDISLKQALSLEAGGTITALQIQREFLAAAEEYCTKPEQDTEENRLVLQYWREALDALEKEPMLLVGKLDWITKLHLLQRYIKRKELGWHHPRVRRMDILYHDITPDRGLFHILEREGKTERIIDDSERVKYFVGNPPDDTRAWFRSHCMRKFGDVVVEANWDVLTFSAGGNRLQRITLGDPSKGTRDLLEGVLKESDTIGKLLANLQQ
ncbi:MAG TPA: depupylase/deamidase Dop [Acidobacteriota bacterium]|nr:depupylase/deamidase Dop [Acidobacteriota bacterium]